LAKKQEISKTDFIRKIIHLEAEAIYFRCEVFYEMGVHEEEFPCRQVYLDLYSLNRDQSEESVIERIASYIEEHGIVRREYAAKKYYADSYDFHTGKKAWPRHYNAERSQSVVHAADDIKQALKEFKSLTDDSNEKENEDTDFNIGGKRGRE